MSGDDQRSLFIRMLRGLESNLMESQQKVASLLAILGELPYSLDGMKYIERLREKT